MKLIKRKERATPVTMSPMTKSSSMELCHQLRLPQHDDFQVHTRTQFPTQQALKRQKSSTLSSASVAFFNSSAAGRRHSTGMLPGSEALNLAAVVAAASLPGRKGTGTPAEQELALEMEARTNAVATATNSHQHFLYLQQLAKAKHMTQQTPFATNTTRRRKSEQLGTEFGLSGKTLATSQMDELMAFSTVPKSDASMVQPVSSACFYQDAAFPVQHEQRQRSRPQMTRHAEYRNFGTKTESWVSTSHNTPNTVYHSQTPESSLLVHSKFSDLNAMPQLQRLGMSQAQIYQQHEERNTWYQQQEQSRHQENRHQVPPQPPARDYIDMLLESAALDENLSLQSSTSISSDAWNESNYAQHSTRATNSAQTFSHHSDQHSQLELPHSFDSRF
ncbi:uncharacterized protein PHALS_05852 [Plasmopara halstedii]|uniref:Uncharacterized protein n=1 Tax=Plasmopara halstedii TaxID=4781 RepID=A0A0P1AB78_PLAHL|nr:uncharacterized protein PHALS_05852 [Plasmopara halstedii]CEG37797.1 hypothetical protein PHALS_05852 [Plasmopara halstedii]|eukprot:XP_024574166.1 hypothetical protein PHALS_05852 [Plasmopara halstedii]